MWTGTEGPTAVAAETQEGVKKGHIPTRVRARTHARTRARADGLTHAPSCSPRGFMCSVTSRDSHSSTRSAGCFLISKHPELDKSPVNPSENKRQKTAFKEDARNSLPRQAQAAPPPRLHWRRPAPLWASEAGAPQPQTQSRGSFSQPRAQDPWRGLLPVRSLQEDGRRAPQSPARRRQPYALSSCSHSSCSPLKFQTALTFVS